MDPCHGELPVSGKGHVFICQLLWGPCQPGNSSEGYKMEAMRKEKLTMPIALSHEVSNWANAFPIASRSSRPLTNQDLSQTDWPATKGLRYTKSRQKDEICQATQEEKDSEESSGTNV
ncbi:hypothetical protein GX48_02211 [Paracoccidioides brasiliensis]|nr:hypothetical protein GX48_02211 [Paracoccidioides brasiliensis]